MHNMHTRVVCIALTYKVHVHKRKRVYSKTRNTIHTTTRVAVVWILYFEFFSSSDPWTLKWSNSPTPLPHRLSARPVTDQPTTADPLSTPSFTRYLYVTDHHNSTALSADIRVDRSLTLCSNCQICLPWFPVYQRSSTMRLRSCK